MVHIMWSLFACVCPSCSAKPPMAAAPRGLLKEDDFPSLSAATPRGTLKEDDFPSLSATASVVTTPMTPAYMAPPRNSSSFQEEDFPALVSKLWPKKPSGGSATAWSSHAKPTSASGAIMARHLLLLSMCLSPLSPSPGLSPSPPPHPWQSPHGGKCEAGRTRSLLLLLCAPRQMRRTAG